MYSVPKKIKIGSVLATASAAILLLCHPIYGAVLGEVPEETAAPSPLQEKAALELRADDIIDSEEYTPTIINADGKVENLPVRTRYYYAGDQTEKTVYQKGSDYSNVEILPDGRYRVYSADTFVYDPGLSAWRTIENATIDPAAFDAVMLKQIDPTLGDLLSGTFHAHAQDTVFSTPDGAVGNLATGDWNTCHDATDGIWSDWSDESHSTGIRCGTYAVIRRAFFAFDLSALSGTVTEAKFGLTVYTRTNAFDIHIVPASFGSSPSTADYDALTFTDYGSGENAVAANEFTLNTAAEEDITDQLGATMKLAAIHNADFHDSTAGLGSDESAGIRFSEYSGTANDPYLELTIEEETEPPAATSTPPTYASSTPGLSLETSIYLLLFAVVFTLGGLIIFSWFADWFN